MWPPSLPWLQEGFSTNEFSIWSNTFGYLNKYILPFGNVFVWLLKVASVHVTAITSLATRRLLHQREEIYKKAFSPERKDWCKTEPAAKPERPTQIYICWKRHKYINETKIISSYHMYIVHSEKVFSPERKGLVSRKASLQTKFYCANFKIRLFWWFKWKSDLLVKHL